MTAADITERGRESSTDRETITSTYCHAENKYLNSRTLLVRILPMYVKSDVVSHAMRLSADKKRTVLTR